MCFVVLEIRVERSTLLLLNKDSFQFSRKLAVGFTIYKGLYRAAIVFYFHEFRVIWCVNMITPLFMSNLCCLQQTTISLRRGVHE